jgi:hypothetical protein
MEIVPNKALSLSLSLSLQLGNHHRVVHRLEPAIVRVAVLSGRPGMGSR